MLFLERRASGTNQAVPVPKPRTGMRLVPGWVALPRASVGISGLAMVGVFKKNFQRIRGVRKIVWLSRYDLKVSLVFIYDVPEAPQPTPLVAIVRRLTTCTPYLVSTWLPS